jgi:hypothetical protein
MLFFKVYIVAFCKQNIRLSMIDNDDGDRTQLMALHSWRFLFILRGVCGLVRSSISRGDWDAMESDRLQV